MKKVIALLLATMMMFTFVSCGEGVPTDTGSVVAEPATEASATEAPATEAPATEAPATEAPATEAPATEAPATEAPATEAPATEAPATEAPATEAPATEAPATEAPATEAPATEAPTTEAPATEAPATEAPATEAPATEAPATEAPATEAPATEAPATEAPATEPEETKTKDKVQGIPGWLANILGNIYGNGKVDNGNSVYERVIIIGVDGGGSFFKDASTPNLDRIFANGAVTYTMQTSTPSISAQSWGALIHGVKPEFHRLTNDIVSNTPYDTKSPYPSFFRVVKEANPEAVLASFSTWSPINYGIIEDNLGVTKDTAGNDAALTGKILTYLDLNDPTILFVQYDNCDGAGHSSGYGSQQHLNQITTTDGYIGQIYNKLQEKGLLENTLFIVTADHGGTPAGGHGGSTPAEMNVMLAVAGKTVVKGGTITSKDENGNADNAQIRDIAAIVTYALGIEQPESWTATVPGDTFVGVDAVARPESKISYAYEHRTHESTPTPDSNSGKYITDVLGNRVSAYLTFDNTIADAMGNTISMNDSDKIYYVDGYYGAGAQLSETYVEIEGMTPGNNSFTVAMWVKTGGVNSDPCLISNKDWRSGASEGFVLSLRENDIKFNLGDGTNRTDSEWALPVDYRDGWVHVVFSVDRAANKVYLSYDFGDLVAKDISAALAGATFDGISSLVIGQDGTKNYNVALSAVVDDVIIINGAFSNADVSALAAYYGINK